MRVGQVEMLSDWPGHELDDEHNFLAEKLQQVIDSHPSLAGLYPEAIEELRLNFASPGGDRFLFKNIKIRDRINQKEPGYIALTQQYGDQ